MLSRRYGRAAGWRAPGMLGRALTVVLAAGVLALSALPVPVWASSILTVSPGLGLHTADRAVVVPALAYVEGPDGEAAGHALEFIRILIGRNPEPRIRVGILEDVPGGVGPMSRPTGWLAAILGARFAGVPLDEVSIAFDMVGFGDGPSDGMVRAVGVAAGLLGHSLRDGVAMTGAINPDGTVGPVGGIQQKIDAAAEFGYKLVLIPIGQRYEESSSGRVDLVAHGAGLGVEVREVGNFYEAYAAFTGHDLRPHAPAAISTALPAPLAQALRDVYKQASERVEEIGDHLAGLGAQLDPRLPRLMQAAERASAAGNPALALAYVGQAERIAIEQLVTAITGLERSDVRGDVSGLREALEELDDVLDTTNAAIDELWEALQQAPPEALSDVAWVLELYGVLAEARAAVFRGATLLLSVDSSLETLEEQDPDEEDSEAVEQAGEHLLRAAYWYAQAEALRRQAVNLVELYVSAPETGSAPPEQTVARQAQIQLVSAYTALEYFDRVELDSIASTGGVHVDLVQRGMVVVDPDYGLANGLLNYLFPPDTDNPYGLLATSWRTYEMGTLLTVYHYNLEDDEEESSVKEDLLNYMLDWNAEQARAAIAAARALGIEPHLSIVLYSAGEGLREGEVRDRLEALRMFWRAEFMARVLTDLAR